MSSHQFAEIERTCEQVRIIREGKLLAVQSISQIRGRYFLAPSKRYQLCGEKCKKIQAAQNKRKFDEQAREDDIETLYKNEYQFWYNRLAKAKKTAFFPQDRLAEMKAAFKAFRIEAVKRKKAVKAGKADEQEFKNWMWQQEKVIVGLMGEYETAL